MTDASSPNDSHPIDSPPTESPIADGLRRVDSLLLVNTGNGKGKSSSAFGTMLRAIDRGWRVAVVQFLKSGDWKVGEESIGRSLGVDWWAIGDGFTWDSNDMDESAAYAQKAWEAAHGLITSGDYGLVILDEVTYPMNWGWIDSNQVRATLVDRPRNTSVICTGRDADDELIAIADTVTTMQDTKHAYNAGFAAKRGIDY